MSQNGRTELALRQVGIAAVVTGIMIAFQWWAKANMPEIDFMPHAMCYIWYKPLMLGMTVADSLIFLSYLLIPAMLVSLVRKQKAMPLSILFWGFALFIFFCGLTHLMEVITIWRPVYWLALAIKTFTVAASIPSALYLAKVVPQLLVAVQLREKSMVVKQEIEVLSPMEGLDRLRQLCALLD